MEDAEYTCCSELKREILIRIATIVDNDQLALMVISIKGRVAIYDLSLNVRHSFTLDLSSDQRRSDIKKLDFTKKQNIAWITDAVYMIDLNVLVAASSDRRLHFYSTLDMPFVERFQLFGMKDMTTSLEYCANENHSAVTNPLLCIGDDSGDIFAIYLMKQFQDLFSLKNSSVFVRIYWREIHLQADMVQLSVLPGSHNSAVLQMNMKGSMQRIVSCSRNPKRALEIRHLKGKIPSIIYRCRSGITCFDYDEDKGLVITGSSDGQIRFWSSCRNAKPWLTLAGHTASIACVLLYEHGQYLFSLCESSELRQWNVAEGTCIQEIQLVLPNVLSKKQPLVFTKNSLLIVRSRLLITFGDHVVGVRFNDQEQSSTSVACRIDNQLTNDYSVAIENRIPMHFREALLETPTIDEDEIFRRFTRDVESIFADPNDDCLRSSNSSGDYCEDNRRKSTGDLSISLHNCEDDESQFSEYESKLIPINQIKLREFKRIDDVKRHVRNGTPFCSLKLVEPRRYRLPHRLPLPSRIRRQGVQSLENLDQLRSTNLDALNCEIFSSLSSPRPSLASSIVSQARKSSINPTTRLLLNVTTSCPSSRKSSIDLLSALPASRKSSIDFLAPWLPSRKSSIDFLAPWSTSRKSSIDFLIPWAPNRKSSVDLSVPLASFGKRSPSLI